MLEINSHAGVHFVFVARYNKNDESDRRIEKLCVSQYNGIYYFDFSNNQYLRIAKYLDYLEPFVPFSF
jgi:hypothetical protein